MPSWDPDTYLAFADARARPFHDLVNRVAVAAPRRVVDLGCGPGNVTATLLDRWPTARIHGVDSSPAMIKAAQAEATRIDPARIGTARIGTARIDAASVAAAGAAGEAAGAQAVAAGGRLSFELGRIETWRPAQPVDVLVSNAALQWVPEHLELLGGWLAALRPGGALAFQVPQMSGSPAGEVFTEVAQRPEFASWLGDARAPTVGNAGSGTVPPLSTYVTALGDLGARVDAWQTTYHHVLPGVDPVLHWFTGTGLRPFLDALPDDDTRTAFSAAVALRLRTAYPRQSFGTVLPFRRLFVIAYPAS